jgi:archaellum component FlaC
MDHSEFDSVNPKQNSRRQIETHMEKLDQIITTLARVETKLDNVSNTVNQHDEVIDGLQKSGGQVLGPFSSPLAYG